MLINFVLSLLNSDWYLDFGHCGLSNKLWKPHDDVIKWKHFPRYWPFVRGIHRSPVNSPHKGQWGGALMFSLIYAWINAWVNNREAGDLRRYRAHYDVTVMHHTLDLAWGDSQVIGEAETNWPPIYRRYFQMHVFTKGIRILVLIRLKFVPMGSLDSIGTGNCFSPNNGKLLPETMMNQSLDTYMRHTEVICGYYCGLLITHVLAFGLLTL